MTDRNGPRIRRAFDAIERPAARTLETAIQTEKFATGLSVFLAVRGQVAAGLESASRAVLHAVNLPAASDIKRLLVEVHNVDRSLAGDVGLLVDRVAALERMVAKSASSPEVADPAGSNPAASARARTRTAKVAKPSERR